MFAFNRHIVGALVALFLTIWLSSGTLVPYAVSLEEPVVDAETGWLYNSDHPHFMGVFNYVEGLERSTWERSMYLRRALYPVIALPFIKMLGLAAGALVANFLLNALALIIFAHFMRNRYEERAGVIAAWILAFFPATAYWGNLPYPQTMIIPVTLIGFVILYRINDEDRPMPVILLSLLLGCCMIAYDLITYFGPVLVGVLFFRRKWWWMPPAAIAILAPSVLFMLFQRFVQDVSPVNINTEIYGAIIHAYLDPQDMETWKWYLKISPLILVHNFFASCFMLLPAVFVICVGWMVFARRLLITQVEVLFFVAALALWSFSNLAPPYDYWFREMRSFWLARVFVPMSVPMIIVVARTLAEWHEEDGAKQRLATGLASLLIGGHVLISFSGIAGLPLADRFYFEFYRHSKVPMYSTNVERFGRHPVGFPPKSPALEETK